VDPRWRARDPELPVIPLSGAFTGSSCLLLMVQPNLGDAILFVGCWFVLVTLAGHGPSARVTAFSPAAWRRCARARLRVLLTTRATASTRPRPVAPRSTRSTSPAAR
jgi:hypothetical protein